ncbi:MAG TPA: hypothetical protein VMI53_08980, partial [Opitutaceae bacterium]|nr:hypothetical protein [Opitutaceae bacterium]
GQSLRAGLLRSRRVGCFNGRLWRFRDGLGVTEPGAGRHEANPMKNPVRYLLVALAFAATGLFVQTASAASVSQTTQKIEKSAKQGKHGKKAHKKHGKRHKKKA